jgi:hypothetical protein
MNGEKTTGTNMSRAPVVVAAIVATILLPILLVGSCQAQNPERRPEPTELISQIRTELSLLDTINRLSLTGQQAEQLLALARKAQQAAAEPKLKRDRALNSLIPLLEKQLAYMLHDEQISAELLDQIAALEAEIAQIDDEIANAPVPFAAQAHNLLSEAQVLIVTGDDQARQSAEEMLVWIRELSAEAFAGEGRSNAEALADPDIGLDADTIYDTFHKARALSAEDYAQQLDDLAGQLVPLYRAGSATEDFLIAEWLVNERFIPVLERRIRYLSADTGQG